MVKYGLEGNSQLHNVYTRKAKWVLACLRTLFCAEMSTNQRIECINKHFKEYIKFSTMVSDFVHQYDKPLNTSYLSEKQKDAKTKISKPNMRTSYNIEEEAAMLYTRISFFIFQDELFNSQRYKGHKICEEDGQKIYLVTLNEKQKPSYEVALRREDHIISCTCSKFEFIDILQQHNLHILAKKSCLNIIMQSYFLER